MSDDINLIWGLVDMNPRPGGSDFGGFCSIACVSDLLCLVCGDGSRASLLRSVLR